MGSIDKIEAAIERIKGSPDTNTFDMRRLGVTGSLLSDDEVRRLAAFLESAEVPRVDTFALDLCRYSTPDGEKARDASRLPLLRAMEGKADK